MAKCGNHLSKDDKYLAPTDDEYLDTAGDALFKHLFARNEGKNRTIALLNALLEDELQHSITDLSFLPTETIAESSEGKICRLDVYCVLDSGEYVNIEMQRLNEHNIVRRSLDYWCTSYKEQLKSGENYRKLAPVICINILNFVYFKDRANFYHLASLHLENPDKRLCDDLRLVFIEIPKIQLHENMTRMEKWLIFLNPRIPLSVKEKLAMNDVAMSNAINISKIFSSESIQRLQHEFDEIAKRTYNTAIYDAKCEGREEGLEEGIAKGLAEGGEKERSKIAISLMKNGVSFDLIIKSVGLSREKLHELAKMNNLAIEV